MKKITRRTLDKNLVPVFSFLGCLAVFAISLLIYSSTYAVVTYGNQNTASTDTSTNGYYLTISHRNAVTFGIDNTSFNQTLKAPAQIGVTTNSLTGYKLYITGADSNLKTDDGLHTIPYDNLTASPVQKTNLTQNSWGIFVKKSGQDYVIPLCTISELTEACLIAESNTPVTNAQPDISFGVHVSTNIASGSYHSVPLVYSAVLNTSSTAEFPIRNITNTKVPLMQNGDTVTSSTNKKLKHRFKIEVPILELDRAMVRPDPSMYTATVGGIKCDIEDLFEKTKDGVTFACVADFSTANPKFHAGQKAEVVVTTKPYGYTFSKQNAVEFISAESTFSYTGGPQEMVAPIKGKYLIQAMGANGADRTAAQAGLYWYGSPNTFLGGRGGYSAGYKDFEAGEKSMVFVGGKGEPGNSIGTVGYYAKGGFNGGGNGSPGLLTHGTTTNAWGGNGGGGGSDVRPDVIDYGQYKNLRYSPGFNSSDILLNAGPWANIEYGIYQAVLKTTNLPDSDFEGALVYYDYGYHYLPDVYIQKFGDYILVYFSYPASSPAATHLPGGNPGPAVEIRLKVKTTNQVADITSMKFYKLDERYIVAGGGGGGSLTHMGGNGGGTSAGDSQYIGPTSEPNYNNFHTGLGADNVTRGGGGFGYGASAPKHNNGYPELGATGDILGRPGAGGGWHGGFTGQGTYDRFHVSAGAGGGSGYVGGVSDGVSFAFGEAGRPTAIWDNLEPADKNGVVKIRITDYQGGVE